MGCRYAGQYTHSDTFEAEDLISVKPREPLLHNGDSLFRSSESPTVPATLIGVRPARHLLVWEGYFLAAELLVDAVMDEPRQALRLVYPILFAYRHATEVGLKFIIDFYGDRDAPPKHGLRELWETARSIIDGYCFPDEEELRAFDAIVGELDTADRNSTAFRYTWPRRPVSEEELDTVDYPLDKEDVHLDLAVVRDTMSRVQEFLDEMESQLMNCGFDPRD